jgi:hypothetical protein
MQRGRNSRGGERAPLALGVRKHVVQALLRQRRVARHVLRIALHEPDLHQDRADQLETRGTKERARLGWPFLGREKFILKTIMFRDMTNVLNERKCLKMVIRSVPDSFSPILGRTER